MVTLMSNLGGAAGMIGQCNAKDTPTPNSSHSEAHIQKTIAALTSQIRRIQESCTDVEQMRTYTSNPRSLSRALQLATTLTPASIAKIVNSVHNACLSAHDDTNFYTNIDTVLRAKRETKHMAVITMDKADSTLVAMCPVALHQKIMKEMMDCPNLTNITHSHTREQILRTMKNDYQQLRLSHRFPPRKGDIPHSYIKPKSKDPVDKNRVITSYTHYPMRRLLKLASKALTFCLRNLNKHQRHFTLHRLGDTKHIIRNMTRKWHKRFGTTAHVEVIATDLKQMYTYLSHKEITAALCWLFERIQDGRPNTTINSRPLRKRQVLVKVELASPNRVQFTTNHSVDSDCVIFTLNDLFEIVQFDLEHTYTSIGNQIFKQNEGCPMGGLLSSFYGNTTCAFHENTFLNNIGALSKHVYGIRQMDDLTLFIAHKANDPKQKHNNKRINHMIQHEVYKGGLVAEIQPPDEDTPNKYVHKFAGHEIHTYKDLSDIYTTTLNENKTSVRTQGKQTKIRYPNYRSYTNRHSKKGHIIGSIYRIRTQNTYRRDFNAAVSDLIAELQCINYARATIKTCLQKLARQPVWNTMLEPNLREFAKTPAQPAAQGLRTTPNKHAARNV